MPRVTVKIGGQSVELEVPDEAAARATNPGLPDADRKAALQPYVDAYRKQSETPAQGAREQPAEEETGNTFGRLGQAALRGVTSAYTGLADMALKGEGFRQASENLSYDPTNPLVLQQLEAMRTIPNDVTTAPVQEALGLGGYKPEGFLERGTDFAAGWMAPGFGSVGQFSRGKGVEELAMLLGGNLGNEVGSAITDSGAGGFAGTLGGAVAGAVGARRLPNGGNLRLARDQGEIFPRLRPNANAQAILQMAMEGIDPNKLREAGMTRQQYLDQYGINLGLDQLLPEEEGLRALSGYMTTTREGAPLDKMYSDQLPTLQGIGENALAPYNPGNRTTTENFDTLSAAAEGRISLEGDRAVDETFRGTIEDWAKQLEQQAGGRQTVNPPDHRPNPSDTLPHLIPTRYRDASSPRALTDRTLARNRELQAFEKHFAGILRSARNPDQLRATLGQELELIRNWDVVTRDANGFPLDNRYRKLPANLRGTFEKVVDGYAKLADDNLGPNNLAPRRAQVEDAYRQSSDVGRVAADAPFRPSAVGTTNRDAILSGATQNQGTRDPLRELRLDLSQLSGGGDAFATFASDWITRKFFNARESRSGRVGQDQGGRPNIVGQTRTHEEVGGLLNNVAATPAQRTALIRVVEETQLGLGRSPQESEAAAKGFAEYLALMNMVAERPGVGGATRSEFSQQSNAGFARHIGAVNVMTPFRQPLLVYVRYARANTHKAVTDLLLDPRQIENLIALSRTPRRQYAEIERILTRISKQVPNTGLYQEDKEEQ